MRSLKQVVVAFLLAVAMMFSAAPVFAAGSITGNSSDPRLVDSTFKPIIQSSTIKVQSSFVKSFNKVSNKGKLYSKIKSKKIYWANGKSAGKKISAKTKKKLYKLSKMWRYYSSESGSTAGTILTLKPTSTAPSGKKVYFLHYDHVKKKWYLTRCYNNGNGSYSNKSGIRLGNVAIVYIK